MAKPKQQFLVDPEGKRTAVVLPMKQYERLLEDMRDLSVVAERREEGTVSLRELKRRLRAAEAKALGYQPLGE